MADVVLNLIYNDNGAGKNIDKLVTELQKLEQHHVQVRINTTPLREGAQELSKLTASFEKLKATSVAFNNSFNGRIIAQSFSDAEKNLTNYERRIESTRRQIQDLFIGTLAKKKLGLFDSSDESNIESFNAELQTLRNNFNIAKESAKIARLDIERIGAQIDITGAKKSILELAQELENLSKYGTTNVRQDEAVGRRVSAMLGLSTLPSSATTESPQSPRGAYSRYLDYSGLSSHFAEEERRRVEEQNREQEKLLAEQKEKIERTNAEIALGYHQTWRGIQQVVTGAINSLQSAYNTWKSTVEAPLNLTGVSSLVSMLESMEGSLLLNQISSNITTGFSEGVERYDILMSFPAVMENIGYSTDQATSAMDRLYQSVLGLPTSFGDIVQNTQFFTLVLDDLEKATDLAIAANNAFVASGANSQQISSGMRQLQYILEGTKLRSTQWYSLIRSMPLALREVGDALGYPDFNSFTADLMAGSIASEDLIDTLIDVGLNSEKLGGIIDVMKNRIQAALDNVTNAGRRMGETLTKALDDVLTREGGKGITENIKGVSNIIDHITAVAAQWINDHGEEIQALIDKFFNIDWASVVPEFLQGLVNIANKALDNIGTWIQDIGGIIEKVGTLFNDIENSQTLKVISGIVGGLGSFAQIFTGISNVMLGAALIKGGSAAGGSLSGAFAKLFGGSSISSVTTIGSLMGKAFVAALPIGFTLWAGGVVNEMSNREERDKQQFLASNAYRRDTANRMYEARDIIYKYINRSYIQPGTLDSYDLYILDSLSQYMGQFGISLPDVSGLTFKGARGGEGGNVLRDYLNILFSYYPNVGLSLEKSDVGNRLSNRSLEDIYRNEVESISTSLKDFFAVRDGFVEIYNETVEGYEERLSDVESRSNRVKKALEDLQSETDKWVVNTTDAMSKIYGGKDGKGGKFFSEQVKEAFGGLFRNTQKDYLDVQTDAGELVKNVNDQVVEAINNLPEGERAKQLEAWANYLGTLDLSDPTTIAQLQKMNTEGGEQILQTFLIPRANLDEVINKNNESIKEMRMSALTAAGADLDTEEDQIIKEIENDNIIQKMGQLYLKAGGSLNTDFLPYILQEIGSFSSSLRRAIESLNNERFYINPQFVPRYTPPQTAPYATGGFAPMGTDTIPAMLTPGEYVQRRAAVEHFGRQFMERINNLDLRGALRSISMNYATPYATGGFVRSDNRSYRDNHATVNQIFKSANASTGFRRASRFVRALG